MQIHLGTNVFQRLHLEVRWTQPGFDRAEGMLDSATADAHAVRHTINTLFHRSQHFLVLPSTQSAILADGAL